MEIKATLDVFNESTLKSSPGSAKGQTTRKLCGSAEHPSERIGVILALYEPGSIEHLHWHMVESFHYIISGKGILRDITGKSYPIGPGDVIYAPPGISGSHEWEIIERLQLISVKATTDPQRVIQFTVDKSSKDSAATLDYLVKRGAVDIKKSFY